MKDEAVSIRNQLVAAFEDDHREMTSGLHRLHGLIEHGEIAEARALAEILDTESGSHIEFEEESFYPYLRSRLGDEAVDRFYEEHRAGERALASIRELESDRLDSATRQRLLDQLDIARQHALSCGTLLSHLEHLGAAELREMKEALEGARRRHHRWTEKAVVVPTA